MPNRRKRDRMKTIELPVRTDDRYGLVSITDEVKDAVRESGVEDGF